jgi:hypothetical protein
MKISSLQKRVKRLQKSLMTLTPEAYPSFDDELLPSTTTVSFYIKANRLAYLSQKSFYSRQTV